MAIVYIKPMAVQHIHLLVIGMLHSENQNHKLCFMHVEGLKPVYKYPFALWLSRRCWTPVILKFRLCYGPLNGKCTFLKRFLPIYNPAVASEI